MTLDERAELDRFGIGSQAAAGARQQFYDQLRLLPGMLEADVFAQDRKIIWSTNRSLVGQTVDGNDGLEKAFASHVTVSTSYSRPVNDPENQWFTRKLEKLHVESYVPITDERGDVAAVARIHKEPDNLQQMIDRGYVLVWSCTAYAVVILYLVLLWFIHRVHITLGAQQQRLVEAEALCAFGEMSAAVVHGIRSPLACMRSSAELALDGDLESSRKNATDIVVQIDRLGAWVRDLLAFSRPVTRQDQQVDLDSLVEQCLSHFLGQLEKSRITCEFENSPSGLSLVLGERRLVMQALANVVANAIEAMPNGGALRLAVRRENRLRRAVLVVSDSGCGMSPTELQQVFKPYFTTKPEGLGLGMSLTKRIMERFGGAISLCSRKGEGTRTSLSFRLA